MADLTRPDRGEALERLTEMTGQLGDQAETYLTLCMSILAHNAPDVATFIMDRADEKLDGLAAVAERSCRVCGCTELNACPSTCAWVEADLCSACRTAGS